MLTYSLLQKDPIATGFLEKPIPGMAPGKALVKIHAAALNRRDYWISVGKYPGLRAGTTMGSDGCGTVEAVGEGVAQVWIGKRVVINPNIGWGGNPQVQAATYQILGMPTDGTLAEYVLIDANRLAKAPEFLTDEQAAALPLAGLTSYRAVFTKAKVMAGQKVLVTGVGGGVAQFAMQFAVAAGAEVYITSRSIEKIEWAKAYLIAGGFDYTQAGWVKTALDATGGFDAIIDSVGGENVDHYINLCRPGGTIVFYGATQGPADKLDLAKLFWKQVTIQGSTMGSDIEFLQMLEFIKTNKIHSIIDSVRPFAQLPEAISEMGRGEQFGKLVVSM